MDGVHRGPGRRAVRGRRRVRAVRVQRPARPCAAARGCRRGGGRRAPGASCRCCSSSSSRREHGGLARAVGFSTLAGLLVLLGNCWRSCRGASAAADRHCSPALVDRRERRRARWCWTCSPSSHAARSMACLRRARQDGYCAVLLRRRDHGHGPLAALGRSLRLGRRRGAGAGDRRHLDVRRRAPPIPARSTWVATRLRRHAGARGGRARQRSSSVGLRMESTRSRRATDRATQVMEGRAEIASIVAHDVRGPAGTIRSVAGSLRTSYQRLGDRRAARVRRHDRTGVAAPAARRRPDVPRPEDRRGHAGVHVRRARPRGTRSAGAARRRGRRPRGTRPGGHRPAGPRSMPGGWPRPCARASRTP